MKDSLRVFFLLACAFLFLSSSASARSLDGFTLEQRPQTGIPLPESTTTTQTLEKDGWALTVLVLRPGSRSQGYHGILTQNGTEVSGEKGDVLETPLGVVVHEGSMDERPYLWSYSGWLLKAQNASETNDAQSE